MRTSRVVAVVTIIALLLGILMGVWLDGLRNNQQRPLYALTAYHVVTIITPPITLDKGESGEIPITLRTDPWEDYNGGYLIINYDPKVVNLTTTLNTRESTCNNVAISGTDSGSEELNDGHIGVSLSFRGQTHGDEQGCLLGKIPFTAIGYGRARLEIGLMSRELGTLVIYNIKEVFVSPNK